MIWYTIILLALGTAICADQTDDIDISDEFHRNQLVPDIVDKPPKGIVQVLYEKSNKKVNFGGWVLPKYAQHKPRVEYENDDDKYYTLIMTDLDAPSYTNPDRREWLQWLVGNIPGDDVDEGLHLAEYVPPSPRKGTGLHRVVFLVYPQPESLHFDEEVVKAKDRERGDFSSARFVQKYGIGDPIAGTFFNTKHDETVRFAYEQYFNAEGPRRK